MNKQLNFLDLITLMSFAIAVENLDENMTQSDKQDIQQDLTDKADKMLTEIHAHLEEQDIKLNRIIKQLEDKNDSRRSI